MNKDPVAKMTEMLEGIAKLQIEAAATAQNLVLVEVLNTLTRKGLLTGSDIAGMISRIEGAAARFSNAPNTVRAIGDAALILKHALLKEQSKPS